MNIAHNAVAGQYLDRIKTQLGRLGTTHPKTATLYICLVTDSVHISLANSDGSPRDFNDMDMNPDLLMVATRHAGVFRCFSKDEVLLIEEPNGRRTYAQNGLDAVTTQGYLYLMAQVMLNV